MAQNTNCTFCSDFHVEECLCSRLIIRLSANIRAVFSRLRTFLQKQLTWDGSDMEMSWRGPIVVVPGAKFERESAVANYLYSLLCLQDLSYQ